MSITLRNASVNVYFRPACYTVHTGAYTNIELCSDEAVSISTEFQECLKTLAATSQQVELRMCEDSDCLRVKLVLVTVRGSLHVYTQLLSRKSLVQITTQ